MAPNQSKVHEKSINVPETHETGAVGAAGPLFNKGMDSSARMDDSEFPTSLDLTSESDEDFLEYLRVNNQIFLKLLKKAKVINHECITSNKPNFPYAKLENLCADIKEKVPAIHSEITKDFIWENVLVWLYGMQRSFEGLHDVKNDDKFNLILSEIIAEYIHYKCKQFAKNQIAESKVVTNEISAVFSVLFESNHAYVLMTLLRINFKGYEFNEKYASVLCPIFKKYLTKKFTYQSIDLSYSRLILCFKKWKSLVHEAKQKENINSIAMGDFRFEKYPTGLLPSEIPKREEKQLLAIFPLYKQAKNMQSKYGRNAGTRTLLREDKSDLNKMISTYFKVFTASLTTGEDDIVWYLEELSAALETYHDRHQQGHKNSRIMLRSDEEIDVIVLPDDDAENNVEIESMVDNGARSSEDDNNNNKNNVNSSETEQKSYGAFSDISSGTEEDESWDEDCVSSSGTDQNGSWANSVQLLPLQSITIFTTETMSQIPVAMPLNFHGSPILPAVNEWTHTAATNAISGIPTTSMFPNSPSSGTYLLRCQNPPNRDIFVNDNICSPESNNRMNESDLITTPENLFNKSILHNDQASECTNLVNTNVDELNANLRETILSSNISEMSDNLSDQIGDMPIQVPSKNLSNMSQENYVSQCEKLSMMFATKCIGSDKIESLENKEMERDGQLFDNVKETKTKSGSIASSSMMPEDSFALNSADSIKNKTNEELDNISIENNLCEEIYDTATIEPILETNQISEKQLVSQMEPVLGKELVPGEEHTLDDYPMGNERAEGLNMKPLFGGSIHVNNVRNFEEEETEKNTENIAKEASLSPEIYDNPATIKSIEAKQISENPPVLQTEEGATKELVSERVRSKQSISQKEPAPAKESVSKKDRVLDDYPMGNEKVEGLNIKPLFGGSIHSNKVRNFEEKETEENTENTTKEMFILTAELRDKASIKPLLGAKEIAENQPISEKEAGPANELASKTMENTEIVNSAEGIKPPCDDNSNNKLETTLPNICTVNESNQNEIPTTQLILKPEYVGGTKTNNIKRLRKSTNDSTKIKKHIMQAPVNKLQDAIEVLRFQPKNNLQALQCMLVDAVEDAQESLNSTDKNIVGVAEGVTNNSERTHKLNSEIDIIPVSKVEIGINIAELVTMPLCKSITDEKPISSTIVYGPNINPSRGTGSMEFLSQRIEDVTVKSILLERHGDIDINSLENEAQRVDRYCDVILSDSLLAPSENLNKSKPENDNLQASQNSQAQKLENLENQGFLPKQGT